MVGSAGLTLSRLRFQLATIATSREACYKIFVQSRRTRLALSVALLLIVILVSVWFMAVRNPEPVYQGRRVREWIEELAYIECAQFPWAVNAIGGNVPILQPGPLPPNANAVVTFSTSSGGGGASPLVVQRIIGVNTQFAGRVLNPNVVWLGSNRLVLVSNKNAKSPNALNALKEIGADAVPYLVRALKHKESFGTVQYLRLYTALPIAVRRCLPAPVPVPALRRASTKGLEGLGPKAKPAIPALIEALQDSDAMVRQYTLSALRQLARADAEAEAKIQLAFTPDLSNEKTLGLARELGVR